MSKLDAQSLTQRDSEVAAPPTDRIVTFAGQMDVLVQAAGRDYERILREGSVLLQGLVSDMSWLTDSEFRELIEGDDDYLIWEGPDDLYTIMSMRFEPGQVTSVHDHRGWGLIGVWYGEEQEERFTRLDDRSRPEYGELAWRETRVNRPGSVSTLLPPDDDIHRVSNRGSVPARSIHVDGPLPPGQRPFAFDLVTGRLTPWTPE